MQCRHWLPRSPARPEQHEPQRRYGLLFSGANPGKPWVTWSSHLQVLVESDLCWGIGLDGEAAFLVVASEILGFVLPVIPSPRSWGTRMESLSCASFRQPPGRQGLLLICLPLSSSVSKTYNEKGCHSKFSPAPLVKPDSEVLHIPSHTYSSLLIVTLHWGDLGTV